MRVKGLVDHLGISSNPIGYIEKQVDEFIEACRTNNELDEDGEKKMYAQIALLIGFCKQPSLNIITLEDMIPQFQDRFKQQTGYDVSFSHFIGVYDAVDYIARHRPDLEGNLSDYIQELGSKSF